MRILVLSNTPWADDNSFGNSYSNIFGGISGLQFANIFLQYGQPENDFEMRFFQITEKSLINNLKDSKEPSGIEVYPDNRMGRSSEKLAVKGFEQARKMRWQIMFWGRNLIWKIGRWKSQQLNLFLDDFQPDLIFQPVYSKPYINDIVLYIKEYTKVPMVGYISDDNYTLRQFNMSPLFWIDRLWSRRKVKAVIEKCEILYVISQIQKEEYEKIFTPTCKILTKCADFTDPAPEWNISTDKIRMIYAGNIGTERWKTLSLVTKAVARLSGEGYKIQFDIYSGTPQTKEMKKSLNIAGCKLHGSLPYKKILELQKNSDILVHVEGLSLKSRMKVHQSFSTKLVDFFSLGKCIFAVGTVDVASIKHLKDYNAAIIAEDKFIIYDKIKWLISDKSRIIEYGKNAYSCGARCHNRNEMQKMLMQDLKKVNELK